MKITKSHSRFLVFVYLGVQFCMKLEKITTKLIHQDKLITCNLTKKKCLKLQKDSQMK